MSIPLSAITESPRSNAPKRPDRRVNSLSEMLPGYKSDTNITAPEGEMPISLLYRYYDFYNWRMLTTAAWVLRLLHKYLCSIYNNSC